MKGLSVLERVIMESLGNKELCFGDVVNETGLEESICFGVLQSLLVQGLIKITAGSYSINPHIPQERLLQLNGREAKKIESLEMIEDIVSNDHQNNFLFNKVALDEKDEKILLAMLKNIELFLKESNQKSQNRIKTKDRKIIFWGVADQLTTIKNIANLGLI